MIFILQIVYTVFRTIILLYIKISVLHILQTTEKWAAGSSGMQVRSVL